MLPDTTLRPTSITRAIEPSLACIAAALVGWVVWNPLATSAWFFADDWNYFQQFVARDYALDLGELLPWATTRHRAFDRTMKTLLFEYFGFASDAHHHAQLTLHVATTMLVLLLVRSLVSYRPAAWLAAALFLLNRFTLHTVSWISLLHDNLTACFVAIIFVCYGRSWRAGLAGQLWLAASVVAFCLALKSKEAAATWPVLIALFGTLFRPPSAGSVLREVPRVVLFASIAVIFFSSAPHIATVNPASPYYQSFHPSVLSRSLWWYVGQIAFLPQASVEWITQLQPIASGVAMAALIGFPYAALLVPGAAARTFVFGWTMLWLNLVPTAVLPNHYDYAYYVYMPMVGAALAFGGGVGMVAAWLDGTRSPRLGRGVLLVGAWSLVLAMHLATQALPEIRWYATIGTESRRVMTHLSEALPIVPAHSQVVLVGVDAVSPFRWVTWYPEGPGHVLRAWYRDVTVEVTLVANAEALVGSMDATPGAIVLAWTGDRFHRRTGLTTAPEVSVNRAAE